MTARPRSGPRLPEAPAAPEPRIEREWLERRLSTDQTLAALAILQADARVAARLSGALSGDHDVVVCTGWAALRTELARSRMDGCIVHAEHPSRGDAMREIAALRESHPGLAIIACGDVRHGQSYFDLGELGVDGVLGSNDLQKADVRSTVDRALATARADRVSRALRGHYAAPAPDAIGWAVEHAGLDSSVDKLAAALGHTPRSLRHALEEAGFPGPTRVLLWGRLLLAAARLNRDERTVEEVAFSLGYSTATSLSRAMKRHTGLTPSEVSEHGGMERLQGVLFSGPGGEPHRTSDDDERNPARGRLGRIASVALAALLLAGCASLGLGAPGADRAAIDAILDAPPLDRVHFGVLAVDASTGRTLYERNSHRWFVPASNQKILVTAAAWSLLGPEYRYSTEVWATGPIESGRLDGALLVVGSGDPSLSARFWDTDTSAVAALADRVRASGVVHVDGPLVVDVSAWDSTSVAPTREVADLAYGYGSTGGAFAIAEGAIEVVVRAGPSLGSTASVHWSPVGADDHVRSSIVTTVADSTTRVEPLYLPESRRIVLRGEVPIGVTDTLLLAQRDPVREASAALARALAARGVSIEGGVDVRWTASDPIGPRCTESTVARCAGARRLGTLRSPPLSDLVAGALGPSQNWITEQLALTLGALFGDGGSWEEGTAVIQRFLTERVGIDSLDVSARDGSGLSAYNLVSPRAIVRVLQHMDRRDDAAHYHLAMAEPRESESTLEDRLAELRGRVFAKTGTISNVNSLSGYLVRTDGRRIVFAILSNGSALPADVVRGAIDDVARVLAR